MESRSKTLAYFLKLDTAGPVILFPVMEQKTKTKPEKQMKGPYYKKKRVLEDKAIKLKNCTGNTTKLQGPGICREHKQNKKTTTKKQKTGVLQN